MKYPIVLNLINQKILVVGGGPVAYRKAKKFKDESLDVTVLSPTVSESFNDLKINKIQQRLTVDTLELLDPYDLVFAATDNEQLNQAIVDYCADKNILVNSATNKDSGFIVPASFQYDELLVSVSTAGKAPFLSRRIKEDLKKKYSERYLALLFKIREQLKGSENKKEKLYQLLALDYEELRDYYEKICRRG